MLKKLIALAWATAYIPFASATLIDHGSYVTDDVAMVDYMKLSGTFGYSWDDVVVNDILGYMAHGWEVTSQSALYNLDLSDPNAYLYINDITWSWVATDNVLGGGQVYFPLLYMDLWQASGTYFPAAANYGAPSDQGFYAVSLWRPTAVPVPTAAWLFGSALLGLVGIRRKRS